MEFPGTTRRRLIVKYRAAYLEARPDGLRDADDDAEVYVSCLEKMAGDTVRQPDKEKRRKERVEAFANALDRLVDAALAMDDPALGFVIWRGLLQTAKDATNPDSARDTAEVEAIAGYQSILNAYELQTQHANIFKTFAMGARLAIKELPPLDKKPFEEQTAKWIEDWLGRREIRFTTSDTGLAGESFLAVMELAGVPIDRASYWLGKAAQNPESWLNFMERIRAANNER